MLGMCAVGTLASPRENSRRRVHSPAATKAVAKSPARKMRTPGPSSPASIEYCTMKMPPRASATPPIQTTQFTPKRSSKLFAGGSGADGGGGGALAAVSRRTWLAAAVTNASGSHGLAPVAGCGLGAGDAVAADFGNAGAGVIGEALFATPTCRSSTITRERILTERTMAMIARMRAMKSMINLDNVHLPGHA